MARRNLPESTFRRVTNVVADQVAGPATPDLSNAAADIAGLVNDALVQNEQAKIANNFSKLQNDLSLEEVRIKNEFALDPKAGTAAYKETRDDLIETYAEEISPLYRGLWNEQINTFKERGDATQEKWEYLQTRKNSVAFVNNSIENSISQAMRDGLAAGESGAEDVDAFVNFANSFQNIQAYATENLGEGQSAALLKNYEEDYVKSFVSGVSYSNPDKAIALLDDDEIKQAFRDPEQYTKMRDAVAKRQDRAKKARDQVEDAEIMSTTNAISQSVKTMNYAELQQTFDRVGVSEEAQRFYMDASGYTSKSRALTSGEKADLKNKFYITMTDFIESEKVTSADMQAFQDITYRAMRKGVLSKNEGFGLLNDLIEPLLVDQKERASEFQTGAWNPFQSNLGFDSLKEEVDKISGADRFARFKTGDREGQIKSPEQQFNLFQNKNLMYEVYIQSLEKEAKARKTTVAGLKDLGRAEEVSIYNTALNDAKRALMGRNFPNAPDDANTVIPPRPPATPQVGSISLNQETGERYEFLGGDPNDKKNWKLVK